MERLIGYDQVILVDAIVTGKYPIGDVRCFNLDEIPNRALGHLSSGHDTTLQTALQVGETIGARLPEKIIVVAVEARDVFDFSEELTPAVSAAIPQAVNIILRMIRQSKEERWSQSNY
jgi:hydrogenase maturation protease